MKPQIEKQLIGRLKMIGWILLGCAAAALVYKYIPQTTDEHDVIDQELSAGTKEEAPLNPFFVSSVFGLVGTGCFFISWKKKKSLFSSPENKDPE